MSGPGENNRQLRSSVQAWLVKEAFPLWASRGWDAQSAAFHERLGLDGAPDLNCPRRMRVQARQIYCMSEGYIHGWFPTGMNYAAPAFRQLRDKWWGQEGRPGFIHLRGNGGIILDARRDLYDHAFALLALSAYYAAGERAEARAFCEEILAYLICLEDPVHGGYREDDRGSLPRRANPHMHLLEAFLAWFAASGEEIFAVKAAKILTLLRTRFVGCDSDVLREFYDESWQPAPGSAGQIVEPGHHFEWCWLICWANQLGLTADLSLARTLYDWAVRHGLDRRGLAVDEARSDGLILRSSRRLWPQTELLKAHLAMAKMGNIDAQTAVDRITRLILELYLATTPRGMWFDQFDANENCLAEFVPASSFYHLVVAFREFLSG